MHCRHENTTERSTQYLGCGLTFAQLNIVLELQMLIVVLKLYYEVLVYLTKSWLDTFC